MKIAILNLSGIEEIQYTLDCLEKLHKEVIAAKVDLFVNKDIALLLNENKFINKVIPLDLDKLNIFNFKRKYNAMEFYARNKYNIAIDTQSTLKSAYFTYLITGKTAGFLRPGFKAKLFSIFYDEKYELKHNLDKKLNTKIMLSKILGIEL